MKSNFKYTFFIIALMFMMNVTAQDKRDLDNYKQPDKRGVNVFWNFCRY